MLLSFGGRKKQNKRRNIGHDYIYKPILISIILGPLTISLQAVNGQGSRIMDMRIGIGNKMPYEIGTRIKPASRHVFKLAFKRGLYTCVFRFRHASLKIYAFVCGRVSKLKLKEIICRPQTTKRVYFACYLLPRGHTARLI